FAGVLQARCGGIGGAGPSACRDRGRAVEVGAHCLLLGPCSSRHGDSDLLALRFTRSGARRVGGLRGPTGFAPWPTPSTVPSGTAADFCARIRSFFGGPRPYGGALSPDPPGCEASSRSAVRARVPDGDPRVGGSSVAV